jgi:hypothetical protein
MKKTIISIVAVLALALALATTAYAQSSVDGSPGNDQAGQIQSQVDNGGGGPTAVADDGGSLPFTGLDLALVAAAGGMLVAAGLGMRRLTRAPGNA